MPVVDRSVHGSVHDAECFGGALHAEPILRGVGRHMEVQCISISERRCHPRDCNAAPRPRDCCSPCASDALAHVAQRGPTEGPTHVVQRRIAVDASGRHVASYLPLPDDGGRPRTPRSQSAGSEPLGGTATVLSEVPYAGRRRLGRRSRSQVAGSGPRRRLSIHSSTSLTSNLRRAADLAVRDTASSASPVSTPRRLAQPTSMRASRSIGSPPAIPRPTLGVRSRADINSSSPARLWTPTPSRATSTCDGWAGLRYPPRPVGGLALSATTMRRARAGRRCARRPRASFRRGTPCACRPGARRARFRRPRSDRRCLRCGGSRRRTRASRGSSG